MSGAIDWAERGWLPDSVIRLGIRQQLANRIHSERSLSPEVAGEKFEKLVEELASSPLALATDSANRQHYEIPSDFFLTILGPRLKYSSCLFSPGITDLGEAESAMLTLSCQRANVEDGMDILELGCGWGSLTLFLAEKYPQAKITAVSNSKTQREFILARAAERGYRFVDCITADINDFAVQKNFDRVMSIEMFEHVRNYRELFRRISKWLRPDGKLFAHIFCHREYAYPFGMGENADWMSKYFFEGGMMPSRDLFARFQDDLALVRQWNVSGVHYQQTLLAWLDKLDRNREKILRIFESVYGKKESAIWLQRWRMFHLACAELFGYRAGSEWMVGHYLFANRARST